MKIVIIKERKANEKRVAASPETVKKMVAMGAEVLIEAGAGKDSSISDKAFKEAGAVIEKDAAKILKQADIVLKVQSPLEKLNSTSDELSCIKKTAIVVGLLSPLDKDSQIDKIARHGVTAFSMEMVPRITRAQSMDVLSSQSNLAGYKAVLDAVGELNKVVPMMMTAGGTIKPAKALILGAGVAGLQAIATAKRLGAIVSAFDVRAVAKEQVESLGAKFIEVESEETENAETKGGYAKEMSKEYQAMQKQLIHDTLVDQDIAITTALIPGRPAPVLITKEMVKDMKEGSVIVDLAAVAGGNCELTECGKTVVKNGVTIIGHENVPSRVARDASMLYANNILNFITPMIDKETKKLAIDFKDEIIEGSLIARQGKIVHERLKEKPVKSGAKKKAATTKVMPKKAVKRDAPMQKQTQPRRTKKS